MVRAWIALAGLVLVAGCSPVDGRTVDEGPAPARALFGAWGTVLDDEIWVAGGLVGDEGTAPPVTSVVPPGWEGNREVLVRDAAGAVLARHRLSRLDGSLVSFEVFDVAPARFLLGTMCAGGIGCGVGVEPVLFRIDDDVEEVPLDIRARDLAPGVGVGLLWPLGASGTDAWTLQTTGGPADGNGISGAADLQRLLRVDLETGLTEEVPLPAGLYSPDAVCMTGAALFAAQPRVESDQVVGVTLLRRSLADGADWVEIDDIELTSRNYTDGSLSCVEANNELVVTASDGRTDVISRSMDGGQLAPAATFDAGFGRAISLGDASTVAPITAADGSRRLLRHERSSPWQDSIELPDRAFLLLIHGQLHDAQDLLVTTGPSRPRELALD